MKKFLTKIMFAAVAVLSVAGFTSCNNADDPYVPAQTAVQEKTVYQEYPAFAVKLSNDILSIYDVTLTLHNGDKTEEVVLTQANGEKETFMNAACYKYSFSKVNGENGVYSVEAKVTTKADGKTVIESMPADAECSMIYGAGVVKGLYNKTTGKFLYEEYKNENTLLGSHTPSEMLETVENGMPLYEGYAVTIQDYLTRKGSKL
ncbi:MAG: hypothetical protein MJZ32_11195 [Bacteroidaceae bacterium]|nr:hypothetical protein [Bacteroidaceae bacterium]